MISKLSMRYAGAMANAGFFKEWGLGKYLRRVRAKILFAGERRPGKGLINARILSFWVFSCDIHPL